MAEKLLMSPGQRFNIGNTESFVLTTDFSSCMMDELRIWTQPSRSIPVPARKQPGSVAKFNALSTSDKEDVLNFLRSL